MANDYDTRGRNKGVDGITAATTRVSLHSGDPGAADQADNELSGGSYARGTPTWAAASGGEAQLASDLDISVEGGDTVSWIAGWNTAGTERYWKKDVTNEAFGSDGIYRIPASSDFTLDLNDA